MAPATRVLLVESETLAALAAEDALREAGCAVTVAFDGASALVFAVTEEFDLAILDPDLPDMEGEALREGLRRIAPGMRLLASAAGGLPDLAGIAAWPPPQSASAVLRGAG